MIETSYRQRDEKPGALAAAIRACEKQIALAPEAARAFRREYSKSTLPAHTGFHQLAIIREKAGDYQAAIALAKEAEKQGWAGDWDKRISRCEQRVAKLPKAPRKS